MLHRVKLKPAIASHLHRYPTHGIRAASGGATPGSQTLTVEVTAKSFIALIGGNIGLFLGTSWVPFPPPLGSMVPQQELLSALAAVTDVAYHEDPQDGSKNRLYRLYSSSKFTVTFGKDQIDTVTKSTTLDTDVGMEGFLQPPDLIATPVELRISPTRNACTFNWFGRGRPHRLAEPAFQQIRPRTSWFIWHSVLGEFSVYGGQLRTVVSISGSKFPSHRVFVNGVRQQSEQPQGEFTNLWDRHPNDIFMVK